MICGGQVIKALGKWFSRDTLLIRVRSRKSVSYFFFHLPPLHCGVEIADTIHKCTKEWGTKKFLVENASSNDAVI